MFEINWEVSHDQIGSDDLLWENVKLVLNISSFLGSVS